MKWPGNSADLNLIINLWSVCKQKLLTSFGLRNRGDDDSRPPKHFGVSMYFQPNVNISTRILAYDYITRK